MGSPALSDAQADRLLEQANAIAGWFYNHVFGGIVSDGGTTQASGANTAPNVDVDTTQIIDAVVQGNPVELAAQTDADSDAGDQIVWGATSAVEATGTVVLSTGSAGDTPAIVVVFGAVATTAVGSVAATDAEITAFLTHNNWVRVASFLLTRTGDTTITFTAIDHTVRPSVTAFPGNIARTETEFANGGVTRTFPIFQDPPPSVP